MKPLGYFWSDGLRWCLSCRAVLIKEHERGPGYHWPWCEQAMLS
jgi:hypothetical protein